MNAVQKARAAYADLINALDDIRDEARPADVVLLNVLINASEKDVRTFDKHFTEQREERS